MDKNTIFKKKYDEVLLMWSVLARSNCGKVDTFVQRLKSQKIQYLAQLFGVSPVYVFNLYLRGPYSPDLAHDLYQLKERNITPVKAKFVPEELESRFAELEKFLKDKYDIRQLEIITSLHWLLKVLKMPKQPAQGKLEQWKAVTQSEFDTALLAVKLIP